MFSCFKVEKVRIVEKTLLILDGICYPHIMLGLTGTHVVITSVLSYGSFVLPVAVERKGFGSRERILAVKLHRHFDNGIFARYGVVEHLQIVETRFGNLKFVIDNSAVIGPDENVLLSLKFLYHGFGSYSVAVLGKGSVILGVYYDIPFGSGRVRVGIKVSCIGIASAYTGYERFVQR